MHLPDFLVVGPIKCGTTQLYRWLGEHPEICLSKKVKEINFFNNHNNYSKGIGWYSSFFNDCQDKFVGDVSPTYFHFRDCPRRIKQTIPDVKLLFVFRNPIERIYSQYKHFVMYTGYKYDFNQYLVDYPLAVEISHYYKYLSGYTKCFSKKQIKIIIFEKLIKDPSTNLLDIYSFLKLKKENLPIFVDEKVNESKIPRFQNIVKYYHLIIKRLHKKNVYWSPVKLKSIKTLKRIMFSKKGNLSFPVLSDTTRNHLKNVLIFDIIELEKYMNYIGLLDFWDLNE